MLIPSAATAAPPRYREAVELQSGSAFPIFLLALYFIVEYVRPSFLESFRPAIVLQSVILLMLLVNLQKVFAVLKEKYFFLYLLLLFEMVIHVPIATNNRWALYGLIPMVTYFIISVSFCVFVDQLEKLKILISALIVMLAVCAFAGALTAGGFFRGKGYMGDSNDFALMMNVMIPIAFFMGLASRGAKRALYWATVPIFVAANVVSLSRGGFVGMAAVALVCWYYSKSRVKSLIICLFVLVAFAALIPHRYFEEMQTIETEGADSGTGRERIELWKIATRVFIYNPLIGIGQSNLPWVMEGYQNLNDGYWKRGVGGRVTHSIYFTVLPELGIVGFTLWGLIFLNAASKYREISRARFLERDEVAESEYSSLNYIMLGLFVGLVGYLVSGIFLSVFYYPQFWNLTGIMTAGYRIFENQISSARRDSPLKANQSSVGHGARRTTARLATRSV